MTLLSEAEVMQTKLCVHGKANVHNWTWNRWDQIKEEGGKFCIPQDQPTPPPIPQIIKSHFFFFFLTITVFIVAYLVHITLTCFTCCDVKPFQNKTEDWQNIINIGPIILYSLLSDVNVCAELWQLSQPLLICQMPQSFSHLYGFSLDALQ